MWVWQNEATIAKWLILVIILIVLICTCFLWAIKANHLKHIQNINKIKELKKKHLKTLEISTVNIQENERQRIGSDLHDSVINSLNILYLKTQAGYREENIQENIQETIDITRRISHELNPPFLDYQSIEELLNEFIRPWTLVYSIKITTDVRVSDCLSTEMKMHVLRILQELITNIHKHAHCKCIYVHLRFTSGYFIMLIGDNGKGFSVKKTKKGLGISNIQHRVNILGANCTYKKRHPTGTTFLMVKNLHK